MKRKIYIIGNNNNSQNISDGGRIKLRLFAKLLSENNEVTIIDLSGWKKNILRVVYQIKKAIKEQSTIVIMAGPSGCRILIPIINYFNKKHKSKAVFCALGVGTIDKLIKKMDVKSANEFLNCQDFFNISDSKMGKQLSKLDYVVLENNNLDCLYKTFYGLTNTVVLQNIRDVNIKRRAYKCDGEFSILFFGRVNYEKGILDLVSVVKEINENETFQFRLDIYGDNQLTGKDREWFLTHLDSRICYKGVANNENAESIYTNYDLFCLPTKYHGEGSSGSLIESMIFGTPCLVSSYSQANVFITDCVDGFIFDINSKESLKEKLLYIYKNRSTLFEVGKKAQEKSKKYTFDENKDLFEKIF